MKHWFHCKSIWHLSPPNLPVSATLSTPCICLQQLKMKEGHFSCLVKDSRNNKASSIPQSNIHKLKCHEYWFSLSIRVLFFLFVATFKSITPPIFSDLIAYANMDPAYVVKFSSLLAFSLRYAGLLSFNRLGQGWALIFAWGPFWEGHV